MAAKNEKQNKKQQNGNKSAKNSRWNTGKGTPVKSDKIPWAVKY